jgi:hypothetical protein
MRQSTSYFAGLCALVAGCGYLVGCAADVGQSTDEEVIGEIQQGLSGGTEPGPDQVLTCINSDYGYWGCELVGVGLWPWTVGVPNDTLSSFKVGSNVRVTFFGDSVYGGSYGTYGPGTRVPNMSGYAPGHDTASSMRVVTKTTPDCRSTNPPTGWVFLYRDSNFLGDCVARQAGSYWHISDIGLKDDSLSSLKIGPSASAVYVWLYRDTNMGGPVTSYSTNPGYGLAVPSVQNGDTMSSMFIQ